MPRFVVALFLVLGVALALSDPAGACGDKFLVASQAPTHDQAFAAMQPGRILIYRHSDSQAASVMDDNLRETLQRVGHYVEVVETPDDLSRALDSGSYDIVLADVQDVESMQKPGAEKAPVMLPVVYKASWTEVNKLKQAYQLVLNAPSRISQVLALVDDAMKLSRAAG